jgi:hypothetical protein
MHTFHHIFNQTMLCVSSFQLSLPEMMMGINEARGDDLPLTVNDLDVLVKRYCKVRPNFCDDIVTDENICINKWNNVVIVIMAEDCSSTEQDRGGHPEGISTPGC